MALELSPSEAEGCAACLEALGFARVPAPLELREYVTWLERDGTQIHLIESEAASPPPLGHPAVVVDDFDTAFAALEAAGHNPERHRELWGEPRAFVTLPGGNRIEFMAAPPKPAASGK